MGKADGEEYVEAPSELMGSSDVFSLRIPVTSESTYIVRVGAIALMIPGSILINVNRGVWVDTKTLIQVLESGYPARVELNYDEEEDGVLSEVVSGRVVHDDELARLLAFPDMLVTSRREFLTREALTEIARIAVANIPALAGRDPLVEQFEVT